MTCAQPNDKQTEMFVLRRGCCSQKRRRHRQGSPPNPRPQALRKSHKALINSKSVQFKVQNLSDTMAEMMAAQDENPLDEDEVEARTVIKKRGRFGTLGKLANKAADKSGLGAAT
eukprot:COSAG04_NODE_5353_length_1645_cov_1.239327_2_plen_114_part_01